MQGYARVIIQFKFTVLRPIKLRGRPIPVLLYSSKVPEQKMKDPICTEQVQYTRKHYN